MANSRNMIVSGLTALVLGASLLPLEAEARPSRHKVGPINPEIRAIVEYVINNPATLVQSEPAYNFTVENCGQKGGNVGCSQSGVRNTYNYKFILDGQEVTVSYQDLDSTGIHSDGKIGPEDYLFVHQRRNPHKSFHSYTDSGLDGKVDNSFDILSTKEFMEEANKTQKAYELILKEVGEYVSKHPLKK